MQCSNGFELTRQPSPWATTFNPKFQGTPVDVPYSSCKRQINLLPTDINSLQDILPPSPYSGYWDSSIVSMDVPRNNYDTALVYRIVYVLSDGKMTPPGKITPKILTKGIGMPVMKFKAVPRNAAKLLLFRKDTNIYKHDTYGSMEYRDTMYDYRGANSHVICCGYKLVATLDPKINFYLDTHPIGKNEGPSGLSFKL